MAYQQYRKAGQIRGVLFDLDGVILDTEKLYARFWREAAVELGYPMTHEQALGMCSLSRGAGQARLESYFGPGIDINTVRARRIERMDAYIEENGVDLKPGIRELLEAVGVPDWYLGSIEKIDYLFPKAHSISYLLVAYRLAWYQTHFPEKYAALMKKTENAESSA